MPLIKIEFDGSALERLGNSFERLSQDDIAGQRLATLCRNLMDEYVPFDTGQLASTVEVNPWKLTYRREGLLSNYKGQKDNGTLINYTKSHHPNATHHWDNAMITNKGEQLRSEAAKILMERLKRINGSG